MTNDQYSGLMDHLQKRLDFAKKYHMTRRHIYREMKSLTNHKLVEECQNTKTKR